MFKWWGEINSIYENLFGESTGNEEGDDSFSSNDIARSNFSKDWGYYGSLIAIQESGIGGTTLKNARELNVIEALNFLSYKKGLIEQANMKK